MFKYLTVLVALSATVLTLAQLDTETDKILYEDNIAEESQSDENIYQNTIISKPIFNDGKPFYLERDATGNLDFNNKKTVGLQNDIPINRKDVSVGSGKPGSHDINSIAPNIHDYLNLPVKYSSSKFVYPMISGSYANLKYQGHNKYQVSNHKNYTTTIGTTAAPKYFTHITNPAKSSFPTTFQNPEPTRFVQPTTTTQSSTRFSTTTRPTTTTTATTTTTTPKPTTTTTRMVTETTTMVPEQTTLKYSSTILQSFSTSFKNKYVDSSETRRKSTTAAAPATTQRIFTSRLTKTTRGPTRSTGKPIKFIDDSLDVVSIGETRPTTYKPTLSAEPTKLSFATSMPMAPSGFKRMPTEAPKKNQTQKITFEGQDPSIMSLSEIFNSISGNDDLSDEQNNIRFDASNSIPVEVTRPPVAPSPTAAPNEHKTLQQQYFQNKQQHQFISLPVNTPTQKNVQQQQQQFKYGQQPIEQPQQLASASQNVGFPIDEDYVEFENPQDHFVKFEVQKPNVNMVQFKQIPSMNNVVISPDQNSASFVLGSQQSVGNVGVGSSMGIGSSLFSESSYNKGPVKLGTVINESPPMRPGSVSMSTLQSNNIKNVNMQPQIQASIRFPSDLDHSFDNAPIVKGTIKMDVGAPNAPIALAQNQSPSSKNQLVFPNNDQLSPESMNAELSVGMPAPVPSNPSRVIFDNVNDIYEKINDKNLKNDISSNELPTDLTPPNYRPAGNFNKINLQQNQQQQNQQQNQQQQNQHQQNQQQQQQNQQQRPLNRPPPNQYQMQRRPGPQRPGIPGLPNILPQFRPNAKTSQGHSQFYKDVGTIRVPQGGNPNFRQYPVDQRLPIPKTGLPMNLNSNTQMAPNSNFRRLSMSPQSAQQQQQQQQPNRQFVSRIMSQQQQQQQQQLQQQQSFEQTIDNGNRRLYRIPQPQIQDRVYMKPPHPGFPPKRFLQEGVPETQQMQMQRPGNNQGPQYQQQGPQFPSNQGPQFLNQGQQYPNSQQLQMNQGPPQFQKGPFSNNQPPPPQFQNINPAQYPDYELNKQLPAMPQFIQKPIESNGDSNSTHLEPVITLQMLQGKKGSSNKLNLPAVPQDVSQDLQDSQDSQDQQDQQLNERNDGTGKVPSVYVVYPTSGHNNLNRPYPVEPVPQFSGLVDESSVVIANHGEPTIQGVGPSEYQNTPFSVVSHFEQEPLLMAKEKRKNSFPYHMERLPHQSHDQQHQQNFNQNYDYSQEGSVDHYNIGEEPTNAARVVNKRPPFTAESPEAAISSKLTRVTDKPIAIAYTPTEPNHNKYQTTTSNYYQHPHHSYGQQTQQEMDDKYSVPNYGGPVISEILDDKQNGYDYYQQHLQQTLQQHQLNHGEDLDYANKNRYDFQAPFHASVSLGAEQVTNPYEGWSVVTKGTDTNKIDRSDSHVTNSIDRRNKDEETSTKKFDPNQFQPEYLSGFMPIFNKNSGSNSASSSAASNSESNEMPMSSIFALSTQPITAPPTSAQLRSAVTEKQEIEAEEEDNVKEAVSDKSNETVETTTATTITTTSSVKPVEEKKKVQIDSLEAFFDSLTRDYEDSKEETSQSSSKSDSDSESRSE